MDIVLLVDGENFKGKAESVFNEANKDVLDWSKFKFKELFDKVLSGVPIKRKIFYFARIKEHPETLEKSKKLIEEQRLLKTHLERSGFEVVLAGMVRGNHVSGKGNDKVIVFKEKGVDVKIAVDMVAWSCDKKVSKIVLCSSDSDLQPAITEVKSRAVECVYLGFEKQPNKGMSFTTNKTILIRDSEVLESA